VLTDNVHVSARQTTNATAGRSTCQKLLRKTLRKTMSIDRVDRVDRVDRIDRINRIDHIDRIHNASKTTT
jgi:hypothetical protein